MRLWIARRLHELVDDEFGGRQVRISHAEINNVLALTPRCRLDPVDFFEDIRRKAFDLVEVGNHEAHLRELA